MACAAIAYDIDGTLTTANPEAVRALNTYAAALGVPTFINTARTPGYCARPNEAESLFAAPARHHLCRPRNAPVVDTKVTNMDIIARRTGAPKACVVLLDDRPENTHAAHRAGYTAVHVPAACGVRLPATRFVAKHIAKCCASSRDASKRAA